VKLESPPENRALTLKKYCRMPFYLDRKPFIPYHPFILNLFVDFFFIAQRRLPCSRAFD